MNFRVGSFAKIDNLKKMCNLDNSWKKPWKNWQKISIRQVKSMLKFFHALKAFPNFSFVCFHWKLTWYLGKVNKKVKTERESHFERVWGSRVSTFSLAYSVQRSINYCCRICTNLCMVFKKCLFIELLCRPLLTKYAHCKPLFPF